MLRYSASADTTTLVYLASTPTRINDLFCHRSTGAEPRQLTHVNDTLFGQSEPDRAGRIWYESFDGQRIQAWVQRPPGFDPTKKYPLILDIHGGPHAAYGYIFEHEFQWMAAQGYVVLYPNPRGSTSYGQTFGNVIQYKYPGDDFKDLMAGVDEIVRRGGIDEKKMGVTGGERRRPAHELGRRTHRPFRGSGRRSATSRTGPIGSAQPDFTLFQPNWFKTPPFRDEDRRLQGALTPYLRRECEDATDACAR